MRITQPAEPDWTFVVRQAAARDEPPNYLSPSTAYPASPKRRATSSQLMTLKKAAM